MTKKILPWIPSCCLVAVLFGWGVSEDLHGSLWREPAKHGKMAAGEVSAQAAGNALNGFLKQLEKRASEDSDAALREASQISDPSLRQLALAKVCNQLADRNPAHAMETAAHFQLGKESDWLMKNLIQRWAQVDMEAACQWSLRQQPGHLRDALVARLAFMQARMNPAGAANVAMAPLHSATPQEDTEPVIVRQWATRDPKGAEAWAELFPLPN